MIFIHMYVPASTIYNILKCFKIQCLHCMYEADASWNLCVTWNAISILGTPSIRVSSQGFKLLGIKCDETLIESHGYMLLPNKSCWATGPIKVADTYHDKSSNATVPPFWGVATSSWIYKVCPISYPSVEQNKPTYIKSQKMRCLYLFLFFFVLLASLQWTTAANDCFNEEGNSTECKSCCDQCSSWSTCKKYCSKWCSTRGCGNGQTRSPLLGWWPSWTRIRTRTETRIQNKTATNFSKGGSSGCLTFNLIHLKTVVPQRWYCSWRDKACET